MLLVVLLLHASPDGLATVSRGRLAELSGLTPTGVKTAMRELRSKGLLGAAVLTSDGTGFRTYRHPILVPWEPVQRPSEDDPQDTPVDPLAEVQRIIDEVPF